MKLIFGQQLTKAVKGMLQWCNWLTCSTYTKAVKEYSQVLKQDDLLLKTMVRRITSPLP